MKLRSGVVMEQPSVQRSGGADGSTLEQTPGVNSSASGSGGEMDRSTLVRPVMFVAGESIREYVKYFERVSNANGWSDGRAAEIFVAMMPPGERVLDTIDASTISSFKAIKDQMVMEDVPLREFRMVELMSIVFHYATETVEDYRNRILRLVDAVYPDFSLEIKKKLARDFFVKGLPDKSREAVQLAGARALDEAINAAKLTLSLEKTVDVAPVDQISGSGIPQEVSAVSRKISSVRKVGNQRFSRRNQVNLAQIRCFACQGWGHYQNVCPTRISGSTSQGKESENEI
jgi:hypothetical protein